MAYPSQPSSASAAMPESGVQRLNTDLANVFDRIQTANRRVADLVDQFGVPENPATPANPLDVTVVNTNEHICNINRVLSWLEQTISRIDNQG